MRLYHGRTDEDDDDYDDFRVIAQSVFAAVDHDGAESTRPIEQAITWQYTQSGFESIYDMRTTVHGDPDETPIEYKRSNDETPIEYKKSNDTPDTEEVRRTSSTSDDSSSDRRQEQAAVVHNKEKAGISRTCRLRYSLVIGAILLFLIGGALTIIFVFGVLDIGDVIPALSKDGGPGPTPGPRTTFPPTPVPTVNIQTTSAQSILQIILEQNVLDPTVFDDPSSPQSKSLNWISTKKNIEQATDEEILSMFAILTLYYSTGGGQTWLSNFPQDTNDACNWWFVECTDANSRDISEIRLASAGLHGDLPFLELTFLAETLTVLDVSNNDLTGMISTEIGAFTNLREFNVFENPSLHGTLPTELGRLSKLESLDLVAVDGITGPLPTEVGNMQSLKAITMIGVNMDGTIPTEIGRLSNNLRKLDIQSTKLDGAIPTQLGSNMEQLQILRLTQTQLGGGGGSSGGSSSLPSEVWSMPELQSLVLESDELTADLDFYVGLATNLQDLRLSLPKLEGTLPEELGLLTNLMVLSISSAKQLKGGIPSEAIGGWSKLQSLSIVDAPLLSGPVPEALAKLTSLATLLLVDTALSGPIPSGLGEDLLDLEYAVLSRNELTGTFPTSFSNLQELQMVHFGENNVTGTVPADVCETVTTPKDDGGLMIVDCQDVSCDCCVCQETLNPEGNVRR